MLVNDGQVAVPWKTTSLAPELEDVKPSYWLFTKKGAAAYEFSHGSVGGGQGHLVDFPAFTSELRETLEILGLKDKLGVCSLSNRDLNDGTQVEFTQGRANITLSFDMDPHAGDKSIEVVWIFEQLPPQEGKCNILSHLIILIALIIY